MTDDTADDSGNASGSDSREWKLSDRLTSRRDVLKTGAATSAVLGLGVTGAAVAMDDDSEADGEIASVTLRNQTTDGATVTVDSVTLPDGGYVTIHDASLLDGAVVESVVGVGEYLDAGTYEDVEVDLFDVIGAEFDQSALEETQPLFAMPHEETNDNQEYNFVGTGGEADGPYVRDGQAVIDVGYAVVDGVEAEDTETPDGEDTETPDDEESAEEASVTFLNQTTDGSVVAVAAVTLPDGGYVTIHDASLLDGAVVESVVGVSEYLEAGRFVDGEIPLFEVPGAEFDQSALDETQALIAMPHEETNDNQEYEFVESGGEVDGPYLQGGQPVINAAFAVVETDETETPTEDETETPGE